MAGSSEEISLLLIGRTGNGKSSTGNSILGQKVFEIKSSVAPVTIDKKSASSTLDGRTITVVEGPDIGDNTLKSMQEYQKMLNAVMEALPLSPNGFSAMLTVLKFGVRFTKQEKDAVEMIKSIFGQNIFNRHGVIVMTHGDNFDLEFEDDEMTFEDWCKEQTGDMQALFEECQYRCVLFNNKTKDEERMRLQRSSLQSQVDKVKSNPFTERDFQEAESGRSKLQVASELPKLQASTRDFVNEIYADFDRMDKDSSLNADAKGRKLERLKDRVAERRKDLQNQDKGTGTVANLLLELDVLQASIATRLSNLQRMPINVKNVDVVHAQPASIATENQRNVSTVETRDRDRTRRNRSLFGKILTFITEIILLLSSYIGLQSSSQQNGSARVPQRDEAVVVRILDLVKQVLSYSVLLVPRLCLGSIHTGFVASISVLTCIIFAFSWFYCLIPPMKDIVSMMVYTALLLVRLSLYFAKQGFKLLTSILNLVLGCCFKVLDVFYIKK